MSKEIWYCYAVQFYKDGIHHVPHMDDIFSTLDPTVVDECFPSFINGYYLKHTLVSQKADEYTERTYRTPWYVYSGVRISRTEENELEFQEIERESKNEPKHMGHKVLEIWRYSFRDEDIVHPDEFLVVQDYSPLTGGLLVSESFDSLHQLVKHNATHMGWTQTEILLAVKKAVDTDVETLEELELERITTLKKLVSVSPDLLPKHTA